MNEDCSYPIKNDFEIPREFLFSAIRSIINAPEFAEAGYLQDLTTALIQIETLLNNLLKHKHGSYLDPCYSTEPLYPSPPTSVINSEEVK